MSWKLSWIRGNMSELLGSKVEKLSGGLREDQVSWKLGVIPYLSTDLYFLV